MSLKLSLENFQSFPKAELEVTGFTVVTGANDLGKSALMRAIRYAMDNQRGDYFIRNGKRKTNVTLVFDYPSHGLKQRTIEWEKQRGSSATYVDHDDKADNGVATRYEKPEGGMTFIDPAIRFGDIAVGDDAVVTPQIAMGYDGPFVVTASDDGIYKAFSGLFDLTLLQHLETSIRQEEALNRRTLLDNGKTLDLRRAEYDQINYPALLSVVREVVAALEGVREILANQNELQVLSQAMVDVAETKTATLAAREAVHYFSESLASAAVTQADHDVLSALTGALDAVQGEAGRIREVSGALQDFISDLKPEVAQGIILLSPLANLNYYRNLMLPGRQALAGLVENLGSSDEMRDLQNTLAALDNVVARRQGAQKSKAGAQQRLDEVQAQVEALGVCPLCRRPMDHQHT